MRTAVGAIVRIYTADVSGAPGGGILRRLVMIAISGAEVQFPRGKLHFCARNRDHERAVPSGGRSISTSGSFGAVILNVRPASAIDASTPRRLDASTRLALSAPF